MEETVTAELTADQRTAIIGALSGAGVGEVITPRSRRIRRLQYFKRCERPNCPSHRSMKGWIVVGPSRETNPAEHEEWIQFKHMTPLPKEFGHEVYGEKNGYMVGTPAGSQPFRYARILMHPQGMAQFPIDQIIAYGWHRIPDMLKLMTPEQRRQAEAVFEAETICPYGCPDPVRRDMQMRFYSEEMRDAHLHAFHRGADMARITAAAIGEELRKATSGVDEQTIAAVVSAVMNALDKKRVAEAPVPKRDEIYERVAARVQARAAKEE